MSQPTTTPAIADVWPTGHLIGKFELREAVSRSASGIVYRAWDRDLGFAVAVKEHLPAPLARREPDGDVVPAAPSQAAAYAGSLQAFIQATRALAHCDHPALVHVLQLQFGHGTAYRVMPWVDGDPLLDARQRMARPPDERALRNLLDDLLGALEAFHRTGNVHGGVHPSQILLRRDERAMLLGPADLVVEPAAVAGPWTDLRALAEVARFWIGGTLPAADRQRTEPTAKIVERMSFHTRGLRYGRAFMRAIDAAASPDAAQRPQSADEFRERLADAERTDGRAGAMVPVVSVAPVGAAEVTPTLGPDFATETTWRPPPPDSRYTESAQRSRVWWIAGAAAAALLVAIGFGIKQSLSPSKPPAVASAQPGVPSPPSSTRPAAAPAAPAVVPLPVAPPTPAPAGVQPPPPAAVQPPAAPTAQPAAPPPPVEAAAAPVKRRAAAPAKQADASPRAVSSPREACGQRTQFSLYRCMQQQCERAAWMRHPQCVRFRVTDRVE